MLCKTCPLRAECKSPCEELELDLRQYHRSPKRIETPTEPNEITELLDKGIAEPLWNEEQHEDNTVTQAVSMLPPTQRQIIYMTFWHGLSQSVIAKVLGVQRGTVAKYLFRAKATLRQKLSRSYFSQKDRYYQDNKESSGWHDNRIA